MVPDGVSETPSWCRSPVEIDTLNAPQILPAVDRCLSDSECRLLTMDQVEMELLASFGVKALIDVRDLAAERVSGCGSSPPKPAHHSTAGDHGTREEVAVCSTTDDALGVPDAGEDGV